MGCNKPWGTSDFAAVWMFRDGMSWRDAKRGGGGVVFPVAVASAALHSMPYGMRLGSVFKEINITVKLTVKLLLLHKCNNNNTTLQQYNIIS